MKILSGSIFSGIRSGPHFMILCSPASSLHKGQSVAANKNDVWTRVTR